MKKYRVIYEVEIIAENLEKAEERGYLEETKNAARLKRIEGDNESWEIFYDFEEQS